MISLKATGIPKLKSCWLKGISKAASDVMKGFPKAANSRKIRAHSFGQFKKHALLKARTQSPCFSYPGPARAFKSAGSADLLSFGGSVLPGRRDYYSGCQLLIERKCGRFICKFSLSHTSQRFLSEVKDVEFYV
jgi:hypothetical protein